MYPVLLCKHCVLCEVTVTGTRVDSLREIYGMLFRGMIDLQCCAEADSFYSVQLNEKIQKVILIRS